MASEFWLSEEHFGRLASLPPTDTRAVARVDDRRVISGIVHVSLARCCQYQRYFGPNQGHY